MDPLREGGHGDWKRVQQGGSDLLIWGEGLYGVGSICLFVLFTSQFLKD